MIVFAIAKYELSLKCFLFSDTRGKCCENYVYQDGKCIGKQYQKEIVHLLSFWK